MEGKGGGSRNENEGNGKYTCRTLAGKLARSCNVSSFFSFSDIFLTTPLLLSRTMWGFGFAVLRRPLRYPHVLPPSSIPIFPSFSPLFAALPSDGSQPGVTWIPGSGVGNTFLRALLHVQVELLLWCSG